MKTQPGKAIVAAAILLAGLQAASARPLTLKMSCAEAQRLVASAGAILLSTGPHTFERYVASDRFCLPDQYSEYATAPTADTGNCPIGYVCRQRDTWFFAD